MRRQRATLYRNVQEKEFIKMKKEMSGLQKAKNKLMLKFTLNNMDRFINDAGTESKKNSFLFISCEGPIVFAELLHKFGDHNPTCEILIRILKGCVFQMKGDFQMIELARSDLVTEILKVEKRIRNSDEDETGIQTSRFRAKNQNSELSELIMNFLLGLSEEEETHSMLREAGVGEMLEKLIEPFVDVNLENLAIRRLKVLGQIIMMAGKFAQNREIAEQMGESYIRLTKNILNIYIKNQDVTFIRDGTLTILVNLSAHVEGRSLISQSTLDCQALANSIFLSQNLELNSELSVFLGQYISSDLVESTLNDILTLREDPQSCVPKIIFLSYVSANSRFYDVFSSSPKTLDVLLEIMSKSTLRGQDKAGVATMIRGIVSRSKSMLNRFVENGGPANAFLACKGLGFVAESRGLALLNACLNSEPKKVLTQLKPSKCVEIQLGSFYSLQDRFAKYNSKSMNIDKARMSIEYGKSETSQEILKSMVNIKSGMIVDVPFALEFLACKDLLIEICAFFSLVFPHLVQFRNCEKNFIETAFKATKIFKKDRQVYQAIFQALSRMDYVPDIARWVLKGNHPFKLCEVIWKNPSWKKFGLHLIRFWDALVKQPESLGYARSGKFSIRLVASITHFINDQEYEEISVVKKGNQELNFQQEREITQIGTALLQKMIDTTMLETFKSMILSQIEKFRPSPEAIQILRADYAVIAVLNGISFFGNLGIKQNMHRILRSQAERLPTKQFKNRGKLLSDCARAIANYIKITCDVKGMSIYTEGKVSVEVFEVLHHLLSSFITPEDSWLGLRAYREWLICRIRIIEDAEEHMRFKIYSPDTFLMTPPGKRETLVTAALDCLYSTHNKFRAEAKVVALVFEVIILLGYLYPAWRDRVAKEFIPLALQALKDQEFGLDNDKQILKTLKYLIGVDEKSEQPILENLDAFALNGGVHALAKMVARNQFEQDLVDQTRPLLDALKNSKEGQITVAKDLDRLVNVLREFESLDDQHKKDPKELKKVEEAVEMLNVLCVADHLRDTCQQNGYSDSLSRLLDYSVNHLRQDEFEDVICRRVKRLVLVGLDQHISSTAPNNPQNKHKKEELLQNLGEPGIEALIKTLQKDKNNPEIVVMTAKLLNQYFPSKLSQKAKDIAVRLKFQPDLEFIFGEYSKSEDPDIKTEVTNLYLNLSTNIDSALTAKMLRRLMRQANEAVNEEDSSKLIDSLKNLEPFANHPDFDAALQKQSEVEMDMLDLIQKTMKRIHTNTTMKMEAEAQELCNNALKGGSVPGLSMAHKELLKPEIALSTEVMKLIGGLSPDLKNAFSDSEDLVRMFPLLSFLNPAGNVFELYDEILKNKRATDPLREEGAFECMSLALLKKNKDSFEVEQSDLSASMLVGGLAASNVFQMVQSGPQSELPTLATPDQSQPILLIQQKNKAFQQNIAEFSHISQKLLNKEKEQDLINSYILSVERLKLSNEPSRMNLTSASRLLTTALNVGIDRARLEPQIPNLVQAFFLYLKKKREYDDIKSDPKKLSVPEPDQTGKKNWQYFSRIMKFIFEKNSEWGEEIDHLELWQEMVLRYFGYSPDLLIKDKKNVLQNVGSCLAEKNFIECQGDLVFNENLGTIELSNNLTHNGICTRQITQNGHELGRNLLHLLKNSESDEKLHLLEVLHGLSTSSKICKVWANDTISKNLVDAFVFNLENFDNESQLFTSLSGILRNMLEFNIHSKMNKSDLISALDQSSLGGYLVEALRKTTSMVGWDSLATQNKPQNEDSKLTTGFYIDPICRTLRAVFLASENRMSIFEKKLPEVLIDGLHSSELLSPTASPFTNDPNTPFFKLRSLLALFAFTWKDNSIGAQYHSAREGLMKQILKLSTNRSKSIKNLKKFPFSIQSKLHNELTSEEEAPLWANEVFLFALGQFSNLSDGIDLFLDAPAHSSEANCKTSPLFKTMYLFFSSHDQIPLLAHQSLLISVNLVLATPQSDLIQNSEELLDLKDDIKIKLKKFEGHGFTQIPEFLKQLLQKISEVEEFIKKSEREKQAALAKIAEALKKKLAKEAVVDPESLTTPYEVAKIIKVTKQKLQELADQNDDSPLDNATQKNFELALDALKRMAATEQIFEFVNLETDKHLRTIANLYTASIITRQDALESLTNFCREIPVHKSFSRNPFFVNQSGSQLDMLIDNQHNSNLRKLEPRPLELLRRELQFMKLMTDYRGGALRFVERDQDSEHSLTNKLLQLILNEENRTHVEFKHQALLILLNVYKHGRDPDLETQLVGEIAEMFTQSGMEISLDSPLILTVALLCGSEKGRPEKNEAQEITLLAESIILQDAPNEPKGKANSKFLVEEKNILHTLKETASIHNQHIKCHNDLSLAIHSIINDCPEFNQSVFDSGVLKPLAQKFGKTVNPQLKMMYMNSIDVIMQVGYKNPEAKKQLSTMGFVEGLVALLIFFSSEENFDSDMCLRVLKAMANFSLVPKGGQTLVNDGIVPAFRKFFSTYHQTLPQHCEILLSVLSNLTYERKPQLIAHIQKDRGLNLILEAIGYYVELKNSLCLEICLDCLTHMSSSPSVCSALQKTPVTDLLVDILRHQLNRDLTYKALRCLIIFADFEPLALRFLEKQGVSVALDVFKPFGDDPKNIFSVLKLTLELLKKYPDRLSDFVQQGLPEKIVQAFDPKWQKQIMLLLMTLLETACKSEHVRAILADSFVEEILQIIESHFKNKQMIRRGASLLSSLSNNVTAVEALCHYGVCPLSHKLLEQYMSHSRVVYQTLALMENLIQLKNDKVSKKQLLEQKTDFLVEKVVETTDPDTQEKLNKQAILVLNLLRDQKFEHMKEENLDDLNRGEDPIGLLDEDNLNSSSNRPETLNNRIPIDIQMFLRQGKILTLYGEDGVRRTMHFFLSSDLTDLKCKKPKEDTVKPKWIIPIHQVKQIYRGYQKKSVIDRSGGFFRKKPSKDRCFCIYGPETLNGPRNFHFECGSKERAQQWFNYLNLVYVEYKTNKALNLTGEITNMDSGIRGKYPANH